MDSNKVEIVLSAGGNPTGIIFMKNSDARASYAGIAKGFMDKDLEVEQFGFIEGFSHLEMSGGEFCGNAARVAALLISERTGAKNGHFSMSGFDGIVKYDIASDGTVSCEFPGLKIKAIDVDVQNMKAKMIDMGGIVHIILPASELFKNDRRWYEEKHRSFVEALVLQNRAAVGVVWQEQISPPQILIHPVVWVRDINSFFYETACGSGTLACLVANDIAKMEIVQPSDQSILAERKSVDDFVLSSKMQHL